MMLLFNRFLPEYRMIGACIKECMRFELDICDFKV